MSAEMWCFPVSFSANLSAVKIGRSGHVEPSDIQDGAPLAGLSQTSTMSIATDWSATRLVARKSAKR
jgi:hypothetical protein